MILTQEPWASAPRQPEVRVLCAVIEGELVLDSQHVRSSLKLHSSRLGGGLLLRDARFARALELNGSVIEGPVEADRLHVEGALFLNDGAVFSRGVRLVGARIDKNLDLERSTFDGGLHAELLSVGGSVLMRFDAVFGDVMLNGASIGGQLQLSGSEFRGKVDLSGATIGELVLTMIERRPKKDSLIRDPLWGPQASLTLRNLEVGALQSRTEAWQREGRWIGAELAGSGYRHLTGSQSGDLPNLAEEPVSALASWIEGVRPPQMRDRYDPQPYEQLARVLEAEGMDDKAREVRYAKSRHRDAITAASSSWPEVWLFRPASRWFIGNGVYPFRAVLWFLGLVLLGWVMAWFSRDRACLAGPVDRLWYSLENALPLMELAEKHKRVVHGRAWLEAFFHFQKVAGFVLATLLVGALTVLAG
jgi:hypothetical protein